MIGQCLSNKNESATMLKSKNFLDINKAYVICEQKTQLSIILKELYSQLK